MSNLIEEVLAHEELVRQPPVCLDLGASGHLPAEWAVLSRFATCIAFDADDRDFSAEETVDGTWRRLVKLNRLVTVEPGEDCSFYLTKSPHCSSSLEPHKESLAAWEFADLFTVNEVVRLPGILLNTALEDLGITYVDWFKADTQGTDLRLFAGLPATMQKQVLAAEFEPGIIDAYRGEDKLFHVLQFMDSLPFFVSDITVKGARRIDTTAMSALERHGCGQGSALKDSPGWAEICYLNELSQQTPSLRDTLLAWVIAEIKEQHGHAIMIASAGIERFADPLFHRCEEASCKAVQQSPGGARTSLVSKVKRRLAAWLNI